jgi:presqualene diphosphate phosphatase
MIANSMPSDVEPMPLARETSPLVASTVHEESLSDAGIVAWDERVSKEVYEWYGQSPFPHILLILLEITGHGVPWILLPPVLVAMNPYASPERLAVIANLTLASAIDLMSVTIIKPIVRRPRPSYNGGLQAFTVQAVDQFSFPSGHATRAVHVAFYMLYIAVTRTHAVPAYMTSSFFLAAIFVWAAAVCYSRVALGRHHVLDVLVGIVLGALYIFMVDKLWIPESAAVVLRDAYFPAASAAAVAVIAASP